MHSLLIAFERHDVDAIRAQLDAGLDVQAPIDGLLPIRALVEMYTRSDRFPACLQLLLARGARLGEPALEAVLLNDIAALDTALGADPRRVHARVSLRCAFTPLDDATLLHVAAEYGHVDAARTLLAHGAEVDARAATDAHGLNGQTPLFHTVNANADRARPVRAPLLAAGARTDLLLRGITWGRGCEWETVLPQMHRDERLVRDTVLALLAAREGPVPPIGNVPNRYLARG